MQDILKQAMINSQMIREAFALAQSERMDDLSASQQRLNFVLKNWERDSEIVTRY